MKKYFFLIPLTLLITVFYFAPVKSNAATALMKGWYIQYVPSSGVYEYRILVYNFDHWYTDPQYPNVTFNYFYYCQNVVSGYKYTYQEAYDMIMARFDDIEPSDYNPTSYDGIGTAEWLSANNMSLWIYSIPYLDLTGVDVTVEDDPDPPIPVIGDGWLSDMWEWILWQLGINDDYSGDIDEFITGGDRERMELVTPTPSPTPTPRPSPTPYVLDIVDPNTGQPVYTITGIPGNYTYNYYEGDTSNGSDFDIFEVDLQVGDGGSSNPRDGINSVMDSNYDYLEDVDITPVSGSFAVLPADWYLLIGVLISFPVIAGFISKLLK